MGAHDERCLCKVCTCGKHRMCKPVHLTNAKIDAHTEYADHYLNFPVSVSRGKPVPQELSVGGQFYGGTESREQFVEHALGPKYRMPKREYVPNTAKLDASTTQRENYQPFFDVQRPKRKEAAKWVSTSGTFNGVSTSKNDFVQFPLPEKFMKPKAVWTKSPDKVDGISTQRDDYKAWGKEHMPERRQVKQIPATQKEDRDFSSTTIASYVGHKTIRELVKAPQNTTVDKNAHFDGISTSRGAYLAWTLPPKFVRQKAVYVPSQGTFNTASTYKDAYIPKTAVLYHHPAPTYVPTNTVFDGKSTNQIDFKSPGAVKRAADFRPKNAYVATSDERDFISQTQGQHTQKPLPTCEAVSWMSQPRERDTHGHIKLKIEQETQ